MRNKQKNIHTIDMVFPLIFILVFCFCALAVVLGGARIYEKTTAGLGENYTIRTAAAYLQQKVREYDNKDQVNIEILDGQKVLTLSEEINGQEYATYVYTLNGKLMELYTKKTKSPQLSAGQELVEVSSFDITMEDDLLKCVLSSEEDKEAFYINVYGIDVYGEKRNAISEGGRLS